MIKINKNEQFYPKENICYSINKYKEFGFPLQK